VQWFNGRMDGVHDLGGMDDFGRVVYEPDEPVFRAGWEGRVFGIGGLLALQGLVSANRVRHAIERMDPVHYLGSPYYEHWLTGFATLAVENGLVSGHELEARCGGAFPLSRPSHGTLWQGRSQTGPRAHGSGARFAVGERVRVSNVHPRGHTRCPRYVRGREGSIASIDGEFTLPDAEAHGEDPPVEATYCVRFDSAELWGREAEPGTSVSVGLWESYLEPA
jgi:nitrile hydratase subunit beta